MKKNYCVHVYPRFDDYIIEAESAEEAEEFVSISRAYSDDEIDHVEVMRYCKKCSTDNDLDNKRCENCDAKL